MLGGIAGAFRELATDGPHGAFEQAVERQLGEWIRNGGPSKGWNTDERSNVPGTLMWSALANIMWTHPEHGEVSYSFRAAGDLIAAIRREGDYMDWYCSGPYAQVDTFIVEALAREGWVNHPY